ncbi:SLC17A5 [Mytilus edulis]|uniref:SLC17A5 n=1 Tax=Mytilus edulis TaxID=6550 RepID=A0A8S3QAB8_MYTED|nr:SLC17A5 [Mytilus edulis]
MPKVLHFSSTKCVKNEIKEESFDDYDDSDSDTISNSSLNTGHSKNIDSKCEGASLRMRKKEPKRKERKEQRRKRQEADLEQYSTQTDTKLLIRIEKTFCITANLQCEEMEEGTLHALVPNGQGNLEIKKESVPLLGSSRFALAILGFVGLLNMYAMLVNINVAIVCMVNRTAIYTFENSTVNPNEDSNCYRQKYNSSDMSTIPGGELNWDPEIQGYVLGGFYWGYLITQMPAGWVATRYGGKMVTGWSMFISMIFTLLTPFAARTSFIFAIVVRIVIGMCTGAVFPAIHSLLGNWVPPSERTKFTAMTYSGTQLGIVVTFALGSLLCAHGFAGAKLVPASMLVGLGYVDCSQTALAIVLVILAVSSAGFQYSGWVVNHIDIAPSYAGILLGISNSLASTTGIISPIIVGAITEKVSF